MNVNIEESWKQKLNAEFEKDYFRQLVSFLKKEKADGKIIYPEGKYIFNAFSLTPFENVSVVIVGQDPYHGVGQAHGLCFSVQRGIAFPPSLKNIFIERKDDLGIELPQHGDLSNWARQGVFLLNTYLTVEQSMPLSHAHIGWETFTNEVIKKISSERQGVVFLLWGKFAQQKAALIDRAKHLILFAAHPSPFSAHHGFFGCKHFSKTNEYLISLGKQPIDWSN